MVKGFYKTLLNLIFIVLLLLCLCAGVDYAADDNDTISNINESEIKVYNCTLKPTGNYVDTTVLNKTHNTVKGFDKIHKVYPTVSMWARPSVRCNLPYKWYYRSFIDYCPHCRKYGVLYNAHKYQARYEQEWTCAKCGADYDGVIGKEKYSWSHYYLRRA